MTVLLSIKLVAFNAYRAFASKASTQIAAILIVVLSGAIELLLLLN